MPTVAESGIKGTESNSWYGMLVPANTPRPIVDRLHGALLQALAAPDVKAKFAEQSVEVIGSRPEAFDKVIRDDLAKWTKVVKASGIRPD